MFGFRFPLVTQTPSRAGVQSNNQHSRPTLHLVNRIAYGLINCQRNQLQEVLAGVLEIVTPEVPFISFEDVFRCKGLKSQRAGIKRTSAVYGF